MGNLNLSVFPGCISLNLSVKLTGWFLVGWLEGIFDVGEWNGSLNKLIPEAAVHVSKRVS